MTLTDAILAAVPIVALVLWAVAVLWLRGRAYRRAQQREPGYRSSLGRYLTYRDIDDGA